MTNRFSHAFGLWLPIFAATSGLFLFAYWALQQEYRVSLNDPQIQMAEDAAAKLAASAVPAEIVPHGTPFIEMSTSLSPWITIYDASGTPLESTATLDGLPPHLPPGVFDTSTWKHGYAEYGVPLTTPANEDRFSWQPRTGVRQAVVLIAVGNGEFVASGRNMQEVENRISTLTEGAAILWGGTELGTLILIIILLALGWL